MTKLARLPGFDRAPEADASAQRVPRLRTRYYAFLSYSHKDKELADWLHRELERFRVPGTLAGRLTANGVVPRRLTPVFRDEQDLSAGGDLAEEIKAALAASQFLIVLCSPTAAKSRWTNQEIESFKRTRPEGCVLAAVAAGEPFASDMAGRETEECFPPALRYKYDRRGHQTTKRAEPLAADFRLDGEGRRLAFLKLVAGMLGVGLDELVRREQTRRHRRMAWLAAASLGGMAVTSTLALTAFQARNEAREQRREAEGLVAFMLGDLKDKLEPIGRLDALDGVGSRVLAYYSKQDASQLTDAALSQRSKALSLMAQVAYSRGDLDVAERLYREALSGTAEAVRRKPADPQLIYDHAQNVFWVADIERGRGNVTAAEAGMREYKRLADQMVALGPDNMTWRMEQQNATANLGVLLSEQRRFPEATAQFAYAVQTMSALVTANPNNDEYQKSLTEAQSWLADAEKAEGKLNDAVALRERHVALLQKLLARTGDVEYRQKLVPAERYLAELYWFRGQVPLALQHYQAAIANSSALVALEPDNSRWNYFESRARLDWGRALLSAAKTDDAAAQVENACAVTGRLIAIDSNVQRWRANLRDCFHLRAQLALMKNDNDSAGRFSARAVEVGKTVTSPDPVEDRYAVGSSLRLLGDVRRRTGDLAGAKAAWQEGLSEFRSGVAEKPNELAIHAALFQRLGRASEAQQAIQKLSAIGYRNPELRSGI